MANCWSCDADLGPLRKVEREELCPSCQTWIHCCKNCRNWDAGARACDEPAAEWVHDRERANFCDFFALPSPDARRADADEGGKDVGRAAFDRLFRKK
jgi:predicted RNA-binding Zn-ribbon protein involved in translation (DUF1610 family)